MGCGIRQGCTLIPLQFIHAYDIFYRVIDDCEVEGVQLANQQSTNKSGPAILQSTSQVIWPNWKHISAVVQLLDRFGEVSGLN